MTKTMYAVAAAVALLAGQAFAADTAPLAPGKPAGVKKAQDSDSMTALYVVGGAAVVAGIAVLASDNGDAVPITPVTNPTTST